MSDFSKGMLLMLAIVYIVSPVDFFPGFIDDLIVLVCYFAIQKEDVPDER